MARLAADQILLFKKYIKILKLLKVQLVDTAFSPQEFLISYNNE